MMVSDGIGQEIGGLTGMRQLYNLLGSAQVWLCLVSDHFAFSDEIARQITRHFEYGNRSFPHISSDTHADGRLKMGVELVAFHHIEGYRTMGEQYFARHGVDGCRIGLEPTDTKQRLSYLHGEHRRDITFTACHYALSIESG